MAAHCRSFAFACEPAFQQDSGRGHVDVGVRRATALEARGSRFAQLGLRLP
jgi:hypothetical protein